MFTIVNVHFKTEVVNKSLLVFHHLYEDIDVELAWLRVEIQALLRRLLRVLYKARFKVRWIVKESHIYHHEEGSLLYQVPLSVNSAKFSCSHFTT